jgi:hypothetical protein
MSILDATRALCMQVYDSDEEDMDALSQLLDDSADFMEALSEHSYVPADFDYDSDPSESLHESAQSALSEPSYDPSDCDSDWSNDPDEMFP